MNCADVTLPAEDDTSTSSINSDDMPQLSSTPVNQCKQVNLLIWQILNKLSLFRLSQQHPGANKENDVSGLPIKEPMTLGKEKAVIHFIFSSLK